MVKREEQKDPKKRILSVCVKMFIERGFKETTMLDIIREADVAAGTFQNIFRTKDGVLSALTEFMFKNQFGMARGMSENVENPAFVYAVETAIQLAITELNENIREIYIEVYTQPKLTEYVYENTSTELSKIFAKYNPDWSESDFYESALGTGGMMRAFMTRKCDKYFTLKKKIEKFLRMSFDVYHVSEDDKNDAIARIAATDIVEVSNAVLKKLFSALEMTFDFKFSSGV
ncbi:MAG TPA: TetR/AcrR family transcriptional regulator [Clostridiales bacterium]|nr:TetR/AcrR family transcriptional regulator [Clostridiales bacterium]